jgi:hypothetical protein
MNKILVDVDALVKPLAELEARLTDSAEALIDCTELIVTAINWIKPGAADKPARTHLMPGDSIYARPPEKKKGGWLKPENEKAGSILGMQAGLDSSENQKKTYLPFPFMYFSPEYLGQLSPEAMAFPDKNTRAINQDGHIETAVWLIEVTDKGVKMLRMHNGKPIESYPRMTHAQAAISVAAITQGYQPPRDLRHSDKPFG